MKRAGFVILFVGLAMFFASCFLFGLVPIRSAAANKALSLPVEVGRKITTDVVKIDPSRLCSISVDATIRSDKVHTMRDPDPTRNNPKQVKVTHNLQYDFPISYRILDSDGKLIHSQTTKIASNSYNLRTGSSEVNSEKGGTATIGHHFDKFRVDEPGRLRVEAEIQPDSEYGAVLESANLIVYDNVSRHTGTVRAGFVMFCFAPLLIIVGAALSIAGLIRSRNSRPPRHAGSVPID